MAVLISGTILLLTACGADPDKVDQGSATSEGGAASSPTAVEKSGVLLDSGFGQKGIYAIAVAMVENTSSKVGQTVTVQVNFLDAAGELLKSESQVETFSRVAEKKPVSVQVELPEGKKAAKIDVTLLVEDAGTFSAEPFPEIKTGPVTLVKAPYGTDEFNATAEIANPKAEPLKSPRLDIVCYNDAKKIIGGGFTFPELIPGSGKAIAEVSLITTGKPASCVAFAGPGPF